MRLCSLSVTWYGTNGVNELNLFFFATIQIRSGGCDFTHRNVPHPCVLHLCALAVIRSRFSRNRGPRHEVASQRSVLLTHTNIASITVFCTLCICSALYSSGDELKPSSVPLRLYVMRFCPWCERVLLYLSRKNARQEFLYLLNERWVHVVYFSVEVVNVDLVDKPTFLLLKHPEGKVPVLEHKGKVNGGIVEHSFLSQELQCQSY